MRCVFLSCASRNWHVRGQADWNEHDRNPRALEGCADDRRSSRGELLPPPEGEQVTLRLLGHDRDELVASPDPPLEPDGPDSPRAIAGQKLPRPCAVLVLRLVG